MGHRPVHDPYGGVNPLIDKMIGNAYDIVKYVARYLKEIRYLAENMELVHTVANMNRKYVRAASGNGTDTLSAAIDEAIVIANVESISVIAETVGGIRVFPAADTFSYILNTDSEVVINIQDADLYSANYKITVMYSISSE